MIYQPYTQNQEIYENEFSEPFLPSEQYEAFNVTMDDDMLDKLLIQSLDADRDHWNQLPWNLQQTDIENVKILFGEQSGQQGFYQNNAPRADNYLLASVRAILSYATGQLAIPEVTPSRSDDDYVKMARNIQSALYQHAEDNNVDQLVRASVTNLIARKRGYLKLRYNPNQGEYGDIITENCNPEDIIISRNAKFMDNPDKIYHRCRGTIDELCNRFPKKSADILAAYGIKQGRFSQMSRLIEWWECWFTYYEKNKPKEGVCWFIAEKHLILDKMPNPNWVYTGNDKKDMKENVSTMPPKPFVWFNYINLGHSFIDETCLVSQARPLQEGLDERAKQFNQNIDFMNGRWVASKKAFSEEAATKFVNKGPRTIAMVNADDVGKAIQVMTPNPMGPQVYESMQDFRNEMDKILGTPSQFKGDEPGEQNTLGRDVMIKQQAGMLQDDLVRAINIGMERYYETLLQMMRVYYTDDYWFSVKGGDGKFDFIMLNGDSIDSDVKIGVQVDSTLPLDKASIRATSMQLWESDHGIDYLTLMEDLGLPNPEIRTERYLRSQIDAYTYMQSIEQSMENNDAEVDIQMLEAGKIPEDRDIYDQDYLNYFNHYITMDKFRTLKQPQQQALLQFLQIVQLKASRSAQLQESMLNDAAILDRPPIFPLPKRTENIRLQGMMSPEQTQQIAQNEGQMFQPIAGAESAQSPANQQAAAATQQNNQANAAQ